MRRRLRLLGVGAWSFIFLAAALTTAQAQQSGEAPEMTDDLTIADQKRAFDAADTNDDGIVSEAEFVRDTAAAFSRLDTNRDGKLSPEELGPHDPADFKEIDTDGDGFLSFREVMTFKMRAFNAGNKNLDEGLSYEEMVDSVEAEEGATQ